MGWGGDGSAQPPVSSVRTGTQRGNVSPTFASYAAGSKARPSSTGALRQTCAPIGEGDKARPVVRWGETIAPARLNTRTRKRIKSQRRRDAWINNQTSTELKRKYRAFLKGYDKFRERCQPKDEDIMKEINRRGLEPDDHHYAQPKHTETTVTELSDALDTEHREMSHLIDLLRDGGVGYMPERKPSGWVRLMFENWNSLGIHTHSWKMDRLNHLVRSLQVDIVAGCESQCDWSLVPPAQHFLNLLSPGVTKTGIAANNINERISRDQVGGTAVAAIGRLSDIVSDTGCDPTGLGRWSWIQLGHAERITKIVSGYLPCKPGRNSRGRTTWEQHSRYLQAKGEFRYPSTVFIEDITTLISKWRQDGDEVVLCIDSNQDVYTGHLACALGQKNIQMGCLFQHALGEQVPNSHFRGKGKLSTIFGSPGLLEGNAMCYPHWYGIGDHRVFLLELSADSLFGGEYPTIARPTSRLLTCKVNRIRNKYCSTLKALVESHNMQAKLQHIQRHTLTLPPSVSQTLHDKWDKELGEFMTHAENKCTKFKSCAIEYSPTVGQWLRRRTVLKWLLRWHDGKVPDTRNMCRAAKRANIESPLTLSRAEVANRLQACLQELFELKSQAPALRRKHLRWRLSLAKNRGDEESAREILRISRNEARRLRQQNINRVVRDPRGRSVLSVSVDIGDTDLRYDTQDAVEAVCGQHLGERFSLGKRAALDSAQLKSVVGGLSDTNAAKIILENTYNFPTDWDPSTVDLLKAAAHIRLELEDIPLSSEQVTTEEFQSFWTSCKESTSSSKSGRHFGHYRAMSTDDELTRLQVTSINLAATRGSPMTRWRQGVTVLLEKVAGNTRIDKLRAICLLEADFNWWLKATYAKKMIFRMQKGGILPIEQGAIAGKTAIDSSMTKQCFFDQANILHQTCAVSSNDAANCYDSVNHAAGSFALQAMRVPLNFVKCYLLCIQLMRFYLKTGFGMAKHSYGGTSRDPYMGLTQGSGASPAAWTAISTVMLVAYKSKGFGAFFKSGWSGILLGLAALLYVDDTDLLHMSRSTGITDTAFVERAQEATTYWAKLLQATGGSFKPTKCYWYLLSYRFKDGVASLRTLTELAQHQMSIPQLDGPEIKIQLKGPTTASEVLGIWSCPANDGQAHLKHLLKKGHRWSTRVMSSTLSSSEVWHSFKLQILPSVKYGLITLMAPRKTLDDAFTAWYYTFLPALGVNRNITKEWRTLPTQYQGLGLPQMSIEKLSTSLQYIQRHWDSPSSIGRALRCVYELAQIEIGLAGNFLLRNYDTYECLATHTWFKVLWEYLTYYKVELFLRNVEIPPVRYGDRVIMEEATLILPHHQWVSFNRARKFFKVYFLSQVLLCDGTTVNPSKLSLTAQADSIMTFSLENPTKSDLELWKSTIAIMTSPTYRYSPKLGRHIRLPYETVQWLTTHNREHIVRIEDGKQTKTYSRCNVRYATRGRQEYTLDPNLRIIEPCNFVVSVSLKSTDTLIAHSQSAIVPPLPTETRFNLRKELETRGMPSFSRGLSISGDGPWLVRALLHGTLIMCHDGSYMPQLDPTRCSAAVICACTRTGKLATMSFCETTDVDTASNYRGELIGGVISTLILNILVDFSGLTKKTVCEIFCDNMGVVTHGIKHTQSLRENQVHTDLLTMFKRSIATSPLDIRYTHIQGHQDDKQDFSELTIPQQLNVLADYAAKTSLQEHSLRGITHRPLYPLEPVRIFVQGTKITSSIKSVIYRTWGEAVAKELFQRRRIVSTFHFPHIAWNVLGRAMNRYPPPFCTWVTKQVSGFNGTNRQLSRIEDGAPHHCPCCGQSFETSSHITRCPNPGRRKLFHHTVDKLLDWMEATHSDVHLVECLEQYFLQHGEGSMLEIARPYPHLLEWSKQHDILGWDNFLEGRVAKTLFSLQHNSLIKKKSRMHIKTWSVQFIQRVLDITHLQWIFRNTRVHIRLLEGKTTNEHHKIMEETLERLSTTPDDLLPQHRHLLELDYSHLGEGTTLDRQYWMASLDSAVQAAASRRTMIGPVTGPREIDHDDDGEALDST